MGDPAPSIARVQDPLLGEVITRAGDVGHVAARDQERIRTEANPPVPARFPTSCGTYGGGAGTTLADQEVALIAPFCVHPPGLQADSGWVTALGSDMLKADSGMRGQSDLLGIG
jgi:hypothetical protein